MQVQFSQASRQHLGARLVVASTSGGKDSTALALALLENEIPHVRVFAEVGQEPPGCVRWGMCEAPGAKPDSDAPRPAAPVPAEAPPRWIGHDHLRALGITDEMIGKWLTSGDLAAPRSDGFYQRSPAFDAAFARLTTRRAIGRGHLIELGASPSTIARWLRSGALRRASPGFYEITIAAVESLRQPSVPTEKLGATTQAADPTPPASKHSPSPRLRVVPCTIRRAQTFVAAHHRHLAPPVGGLFAVGVAQGDQLVGVAIVGRPVARALQDGHTAEVTRVCTRGERNACSMLLGACRRGAASLGYRRVITYTLASEPGTSLKAAGWREVGQVCGRSWDRRARPRAPRALHDKRRWESPPSALPPSSQPGGPGG